MNVTIRLLTDYHCDSQPGRGNRLRDAVVAEPRAAHQAGVRAGLEEVAKYCDAMCAQERFACTLPRARPEAMKRAGLMLRLPQLGPYSDRADVAANQALAFQIFGVRNAQFCEPHGFWLSLLDEFVFMGRLIEVYAPDPKEKRDE